jgi:hypothetical protein
MNKAEDDELFLALREEHRKTWEALNGPEKEDWMLDLPFDDGTTPRERRAKATVKNAATLPGA